MHIAINSRHGHKYATVMKSVREGDRVVKKKHIYLGKVLDRQLGIFYSKKRGIFQYDLTTDTFSDAPASFTKIDRRADYQEQLIVDFGDAFLFNHLISTFGMEDAISALKYGNIDSVKSLLLYYTLQPTSNEHALSWYEGSFARILYPNANLDSRMISDLLRAIGQESSLRAFFGKYIEILGTEARDGANILIDSTGLPNSIRTHITAISNHNGQISEEIRLIYVVQQNTRLPIYMRYVPGNVIDSTTLITTVTELKAIGVNTKFAILDAGYVTDDGLLELYQNGVSFLTRCPENRRLYNDVVSKYAHELEEPDNLVLDEDRQLYNRRQLYVKRVEIEYLGMKLYAYIGKDKSMEEIERKHQIVKLTDRNKPIDKSEFAMKMKGLGIFVLISSRRIAASKVMSQYYVPQDVEQVFDISKNYASLLPLNVESEDTYKGHLILTFAATAILQLLQNKIKSTKHSIDSVRIQMRNQKAKVFENVVIPCEPNKTQNDIYKLFSIKPPYEFAR